MRARSRSSFIPYRPLFFGAVTVVFLTGCATTQVSYEEQPSEADEIEMGYGAVEQDRVAGSAAIYKGEDLHRGHPGTLADMLARIPGVRVVDMIEGGMSVRIRGSSSFVGSEEPLFVIDGLPIQSTDGALDTVNPSNIESISVLKDADATAIYGSRGANGVILIKTKGGTARTR